MAHVAWTSGARFAVTSLEIAFDIGERPVILFQKGNEMHGTVPGPTGSCGLVLISKRNTLQQFERNGYTDRTLTDSLTSSSMYQTRRNENE